MESNTLAPVLPILHKDKDTFTRSVQLSVSGSDPIEYVDLTGASVYFELFDKKNGNSEFLFSDSDGITVTPLEGLAIIQFNIIEDGERLIERKLYYYEFYTVTGDIRNTYFEGPCQIL